MRAIMVMFDSLNRRFLEPYGAKETITPNFRRLAEKSVCFDNCYAGSLPCIPARRELHTGRYNFLHRSWGPLEPFDDSVFRILKENGIHTHLVSDHGHYWKVEVPLIILSIQLGTVSEARKEIHGHRHWETSVMKNLILCLLRKN